MPTVEEFIESCQSKLIDLSKRNRLLNWNPGQRGNGIQFVGEHPAALYRLLAEQRTSLDIRGIADAGDVESQSDESDTATDLFQGGYRDPDRATHVDNALDAALSSVVLATRLRRLNDMANSVRDEQGVETLFLALGALSYFEDATSEIGMRAPLLLIPVSLTRKLSDSWKIVMRPDDPMVNLALIEFLKPRGIELPGLPEEATTFDPGVWFREVQERVKHLDRWHICADVGLCLFSFQKFVMHEDL